MILSDRDILKRLEEGSLVIEPLDDPELQVQPASVDLRLGREFLEPFDGGLLALVAPDWRERPNPQFGLDRPGFFMVVHGMYMQARLTLEALQRGILTPLGH